MTWAETWVERRYLNMGWVSIAVWLNGNRVDSLAAALRGRGIARRLAVEICARRYPPTMDEIIDELLKIRGLGRVGIQRVLDTACRAIDAEWEPA